MKRVLLVGNTSKIGLRLLRECPKDIQFVPAGRSGHFEAYINLLEPNSFMHIDASCDGAIILAGLNNIQKIEADKSLAHLVNCKNTIMLIDSLNDLDIPCLFVSTSSVFAVDAESRAEFSPKKPSVYYGALKAVVEDHLLQAHPRNSVLRLTKVVDDSFFVYSWLISLAKQVSVNALVDLFVSPVHIDLLLPIFYGWCRLGGAKIMHISSSQQLSYFSWISILAKAFSLPEHLIISTSIEDLPARPSFIPLDSRLSCLSLQSRSFDIDDTIRAMVDHVRKSRI